MLIANGQLVVVIFCTKTKWIDLEVITLGKYVSTYVNKLLTIEY